MQETWDMDLISGLRKSPDRGSGNPPWLLPGDSHGQGNLLGYSPWVCRVGHNYDTYWYIYIYIYQYKKKAKFLWNISPKSHEMFPGTNCHQLMPKSLCFDSTGMFLLFLEVECIIEIGISFQFLHKRKSTSLETHLYYIDRDEALLKAKWLIQRELQIQLHIECLYFYMSFSKLPFKCLKPLQLFH